MSSCTFPSAGPRRTSASGPWVDHVRTGEFGLLTVPEPERSGLVNGTSMRWEPVSERGPRPVPRPGGEPDARGRAPLPTCRLAHHSRWPATAFWRQTRLADPKSEIMLTSRCRSGQLRITVQWPVHLQNRDGLSSQPTGSLARPSPRFAGERLQARSGYGGCQAQAAHGGRTDSSS